MIKVFCKTNLDLFNEKWPEELPEVPRIGDQIESGTRWSNGFTLRLEVVNVTWVARKDSYDNPYWIPEIKLYLNKA